MARTLEALPKKVASRASDRAEYIARLKSMAAKVRIALFWS